MKNKKGDLPITILTIGVIAICGLALFSFIISSKITLDSFSVNHLEYLNSEVDEFYFYLNVGFSPELAAEKIDAKIENNLLIIERDYRDLSVKYKSEIKRN